MNTLEQAAELIKNGWCKTELVNNGKVCALGAIAAVMKGHTTSDIGNLTYQQMCDIEDTGYDLAMNTEPSVVALSQEILDKHPEYAGDPEDFKPQPLEIVYNYNDNQKSSEPVLEMFKYAAKRLDDNS